MRKIGKALFAFTRHERRGIYLLWGFTVCLCGISLLYRKHQQTQENKRQQELVPMLTALAEAQEQSPRATTTAIAASTTIPASTAPRAWPVYQRDSAARKERRPPRETVYIELNTADTTQLKTLRGIGSSYARRIVAYREKLGGYYCKEQLQEIYGMTAENYQRIQTQVWVDSSRIAKIALSTATIRQLKRHPYISYYQALALVQAREKRADGQLTSWEQLLPHPDFSPEDVIRLRPYLDFTP